MAAATVEKRLARYPFRRVKLQMTLESFAEKYGACVQRSSPEASTFSLFFSLFPSLHIHETRNAGEPGRFRAMTKRHFSTGAKRCIDAAVECNNERFEASVLAHPRKKNETKRAFGDVCLRDEEPSKL